VHLTDIPKLSYEQDLFYERDLRSVTADTRKDGEELLALASQYGVKVTTTPYPLEAADEALADLAHDRVRGAAVLTPGWTS
jgi:alcohol dehydrogenase, propanol-preferring